MIARKVLFFDSSQSTTKDLATGYASFQYSQPIEPFLPECKLALINFSYTNFFINISPPNNVIYFSDDILNATKYTITIPQGSWGLADLNDYVVSQQLIITGNTIFQLSANYSTGKVVVEFSGTLTGWFVNFTATAPSILGFGVQWVPVGGSSTAFYTESAPNQASFNSVTQIKVTTNMIQDSIDNSALSSNVLHISTPIVGVGSVQTDAPSIPLTIESTRLGTGKVSEITFQILDQNNNPVTLSEDFSLTAIII